MQWTLSLNIFKDYVSKGKEKCFQTYFAHVFFKIVKKLSEILNTYKFGAGN